jgi:hypothetical protein
MKTHAVRPSILRVVTAVALSLALTAAGALGADDKPASPPSQLAKELIGTWILVGTPDHVGEPPACGGRYHFYTGKHWLITQADPDTGVVVFHHGGSYTLDGDNLAKTVEYANQNTAELIKQTHQFKLKIEGDTLTQTGIGNPWTEVWRRVSPRLATRAAALSTPSQILAHNPEPTNTIDLGQETVVSRPTGRQEQELAPRPAAPTAPPRYLISSWAHAGWGTDRASAPAESGAYIVDAQTGEVWLVKGNGRPKSLGKAQ